MDCQPGISGWQRPYSICSTCHLLHPQWKEARIRRLPKVLAPKQHADYRPISITSIMSRLIEWASVRTFLYPAFLNPPTTLTFSDQFALRPTGCTSAAIISLLHTVTDLLQANPFVVVISLDFSKVFDTVQHATLLSKMAALDGVRTLRQQDISAAEEYYRSVR